MSRVTGTLGHALLGLLAEGPRTGYALLKHFEQSLAYAWPASHSQIYPELARLLEVARVFEEAPADLFKIVIAHHHLIPPPNFGSQRVLGNAYEAIDLFSGVGVDLILSGHQHQTYIGNSEEFYPKKGRPPLVVLHSGTTTSRRGRG